jgi:uncharacterized cupredoxin-like copper-binding protein
VVFHGSNPAAMRHELVLLRTPLKANRLELRNGRAVERGNVGEIELNRGASGVLEVTLKPGHYVLLCNIGDHYTVGMRNDFTVM